VAIQENAHSWEDVKTLSDLGEQFCRELEQFFVNTIS
jgi:inorganic pyrophosphatase